MNLSLNLYNNINRILTFNKFRHFDYKEENILITGILNVVVAEIPGN